MIKILNICFQHRSEIQFLLLLLPTNNKHENDEDNSIAYGMCHGGSVVLEYKISIKQNY